MATTAPGGYRIGELASKVGLTERTIRYYEERGLLESVKRLDGGQRVYTDDDVRRLKFIQKLKVLGLSLDEMQELETLYGRHRTNAKVLPRLIELLDAHLATVSGAAQDPTRLASLSKALRDEIRSYRTHVQDRLREIQ